jgi:hypothetical protein
MPAEIASSLNGEVRKLVDAPDMQQRFAAESMLTRQMDSRGRAQALDRAG